MSLNYQEMMRTANAQAGWRDMDADFWEIAGKVHRCTMTSVERMFDLYKSVEHVAKAKIPGAIVECGVWRGGSMMLAALTLKKFGDETRELRLFDTFAGHPKGQDREKDVDIFGGVAADQWEENWAAVGIDEVRANMASTGYAGEIVCVKGMVEETLRDYAPSTVAIARLDTDWYAGAKVEIDVLWPRLSPGGVLIIDDYGHYKGQRQAVDEYFAEHGIAPKLTRVDYSCRTVVKS